MAAASVYADRAIAAKPGKAAVAKDAATPTDVKLLEETDPFAAPPTTAPTSQPAGDAAITASKAPVAPALPNTDGTFSLNITAGADIVEQLRVIGFQAQTSIIPSKDVHGALPAMDLYNVTVHEALDALLHANGFGWREKGKFIYVYTEKEIQEMEKANRVANTEVFRLYYTPAANAVTMIKPVLSADAQVAVTTPAKSGIATGTTDLGGNDHSTEDIIVVTDYPEHLDRVRQVLKEVDRRPQQILIEATILAAQLNEDNALGVDFNVVGGVDFASFTSTAGQILNGTLPDGANPLTGDVHSVGTGNNFTKGINNAFRVGVVTDDISVFVAALEGITDTSVLANPKVLALNKQKGEVIVGNETGYLTTTTTETSSTQTIEFLKTGTRLVFRPYIADDGYIRMEVHPEDSSGGLQTAANLPFKQTTEVTSNVMVKDGHTIVIGGLFREASTATRSQIPFLGNLPIVGHLFKNQTDTTRRQEIIILLTPHIVKDDDAMNALSEKVKADAEKLRAGVRRGMMFWGRERLADMHYQCAVEEMAKSRPDRGKALWNLECATNLNPTFSEAIALRQELTGKQIVASDGSTIRNFVRKAILEDTVPTTMPTAADVWADPVAEAPTSQPFAYDAEAPATQPAVAKDEFTGFEWIASAEPTTQPTSQPVVEIYLENPDKVAGADGAPATNPVAKDENAKVEESVTDLPTEEVPGADESYDNNK
jgi:type IV pilus assembly protein PilQ